MDLRWCIISGIAAFYQKWCEYTAVSIPKDTNPWLLPPPSGGNKKHQSFIHNAHIHFVNQHSDACSTFYDSLQMFVWVGPGGVEEETLANKCWRTGNTEGEIKARKMLQEGYASGLLAGGELKVWISKLMGSNKGVVNIIKMATVIQSFITKTLIEVHI